MVELSPGAKLLKEWFPFTEVPLVVNAPMWQIATQKLAVGVTTAGGLGFVGAGPETKYISGYLDKIDKIIQLPEGQRGDHPDLYDPNVKEDKTDYDPIELQKLRAAVANSVNKDSKTAETLGYRLRTDLDPDVESDEIETKQFGSVQPKKALLPIGVGIICFVADLRLWIDSLRKNTPCAVWMFGPRNTEEFVLWITTTKKIYPHTKLFIQIGSVTELSVVLKGDAGVYVDGIIAQGVADAGGHGINQGASIVALVPQFRREIERLKKHPRKYVEQNRVIPIIAAGGIMTGRGLAAALVLGADGVALGTRFILSKECTADPEQKRFLAKVRDGGQQTVRTRLYDTLRENGAWAPEYNGRSLINDSWFAHVGGMSEEENRRLYAQANETATKNWNRLTLYCGTGVGLANEVLSAEDIARDIREKALRVLAVTVASNPAPPKYEGEGGQTFVSLADMR